jgi:hypothetical protein
MSKGSYFKGFDPNLSRAYDPNYTPSKSLQDLVEQNPSNQFLADRLAEQHEALKEQQAESANRSPSTAAQQNL